MHICIVTPFFYPLLNGVSVRVYKDAAALKQAGHQVSIISPHAGIPEFDCYKCGRPPVFLTPNLFFILKKIHRKKTIDVIISHNFLSDILSYWPARYLKIKFIQQIHGPEIEEIKKTFKGIKKALGMLGCRFDRSITRKSDAIIVVEDELKNWLVKTQGIDPNKIQHLANYPDLDLFRPSSPQQKPFTVGYLGTLQSGRIKPLLALSEKNTKFKFMVVGAGDDYNEISKYPNINLQTVLKYERIPNYLNQFDVGIVFSLTPSGMSHKGPPMKLFEYLACEVPVIAVNLYELKNIIEKHRLGIIVTENQIGSAIYAIQKNYRYYKDNAKKFRMLMQSEYNWQNEKSKLLKIVASFGGVPPQSS
jgi:glycosyltransferase involved in cell wall biosynthesis